MRHWLRSGGTGNRRCPAASCLGIDLLPLFGDDLAGMIPLGKEAPNMKYLVWIAVPVMLFGAAMLVADVVGSSGLWIALITVGIALVAIDAYGRRHPHPIT